MKKRLIIMIALMGLIPIFAFAGTAHAEQCSPDGTICLVTESSPTQPLITPTNIQFEVASEATSFGVSGAGDASRLIRQGPEGGMSLWETPLGPAPSDGTLSLHAYANGPSVDSDSGFAIEALASSINQQVTIRRNKKRVVAIYRYYGRVPLRAGVHITLNSFKGGTQILAHRGRVQDRDTRWQVLKFALSRKFINRKCRKYPHCSVLAAGQSWFGNYQVDVGTYDRKRVK